MKGTHRERPRLPRTSTNPNVNVTSVGPRRQAGDQGVCDQPDARLRTPALARSWRTGSSGENPTPKLKLVSDRNGHRRGGTYM
jgi:hypothetical protein